MWPNAFVSTYVVKYQVAAQYDNPFLRHLDHRTMFSTPHPKIAIVPIIIFAAG